MPSIAWDRLNSEWLTNGLKTFNSMLGCLLITLQPSLCHCRWDSKILFCFMFSYNHQTNQCVYVHTLFWFEGDGTADSEYCQSRNYNNIKCKGCGFGCSESTLVSSLASLFIPKMVICFLTSLNHYYFASLGYEMMKVVCTCVSSLLVANSRGCFLTESWLTPLITTTSSLKCIPPPHTHTHTR